MTHKDPVIKTANEPMGEIPFRPLIRGVETGKTPSPHENIYNQRCFAYDET